MEDELARYLQADGVCVIDPYLDERTARYLMSVFEDMDAPNAGASHHDSSVREKRGARFARRNLLSTDFVQRFIASEEVESLVNRFCPGAIAVRAIWFDKTGDANWTVPWHQDRSIAVAQRIDADGYGPWSVKAGVPHVQPPLGVLESMVTFRFSLDVCGQDNGPLRVIPGTHRTILAPLQIERAAQVGPERVCATSAGGVVIIRPLVLHASSPARIAGHRRVLHIEYGPKTLPGGLRWGMV